jgi:hypothetical protein
MNQVLKNLPRFAEVKEKRFMVVEKKLAEESCVPPFYEDPN